MEVNDPQTFENYVAQIEENPVIEKVIASVGGTQFNRAIEQKTEEIQTIATSEQTTLVETVKQIEQEIFSTTATSEVEQTLPQPVQEQIQEIKQEVPAEQVPQVTTSTSEQLQIPASEPAAPAPAPAVAPPPEAPTVASPPAIVPTL